MPLSNDVDRSWSAWMVAGAGGREAVYADALFAALAAANIPKATVKAGTTNMWWRKDSRFIDVTSTMDGSVTATVHVQEYGTSLFVGRAVASYKQGNYYKRMATTAFLHVIDRCIRETLPTLGDDISTVAETG